MPLSEVVAEHYIRRRAVADDLADEGQRLWREVDTANIAGSWRESIPRLTVALAAAQQITASQADTYTDSVLRELNVDVDPEGHVNRTSLSGLASDGRPVGSLLARPVVTAKIGLAGGAALDRALAAGLANLTMILRTQVADAGRVADGVAVAARPTVGYIRHVTPPSCPRCVVLAGKWYPYSRGFARHPSCDCTHTPAPSSVSGDLTTDPRQMFEQGQIRGLSQADTQAIADGADMNRVINAHRGMATAGGRKITHSLAGRQGIPRLRLRPEQIYRDATSRSDAIRLLRLHGYLN